MLQYLHRHQSDRIGQSRGPSALPYTHMVRQKEDLAYRFRLSLYMTLLQPCLSTLRNLLKVNICFILELVIIAVFTHIGSLRIGCYRPSLSR